MCAISSLTSTFAISSPDEFLLCYLILMMPVSGYCIPRGIQTAKGLFSLFLRQNIPKGINKHLQAKLALH